MATIRVVVNFRVKPGKEGDLFEGLRAVKKHHERLGAGFFVVRQAFGPEAGNIVAVGQYSNWDAFASCTRTPRLHNNWRRCAAIQTHPGMHLLRP